ncbi:uncharacterized protein LOC141656697 [Silene latifolia]|uniref:uncharacterized protein LOC141656697 n=1 Tax=Silene latifolia TaxID=37657 RepID=UPI003D78281A
MASLSSHSLTILLLIIIFATNPPLTTSLPTVSTPPSQPPTTTTTLPSQSTSPFAALTPILSSLGYHDLALASATLSLPSPTSPPLSPTTPITLFAPSDSSLRTCTTCSLTLLLQEHSLPGLYPASYLSRLPFGTRLESLLPGRCLTLTHTPSPPTSPVNSSRLFINGAELTFPDLFSNPHIIIHGLQGFLSHLSPYSCSYDKFAASPLSSSLYIHHPLPSTALTRMMLADAMIRLRISGYSILSLAIRVKYPELVTLHNMTIFAVDDVAIFHGGHAYIHSVRFHILPNRMLRFADLERLPASTILPTLEIGESLTVTSSGGGGLSSPMRINYVRVKFPDMLYNMKLVVHGVSSPFPRLGHTISTATRQISGATLAAVSSFQNSAYEETVSPEPAAASSPVMADYQSNAPGDNNHVESDDDYHDYAHHGL